MNRQCDKFRQMLVIEVSGKVSNDVTESDRNENFGKFALGHTYHLICGKRA